MGTPSPQGAGPRWGRRGRLPAWLLLGGLSLSGCTSLHLSDPVLGPGFEPANVYRREPFLPKNLRRVAVLPLTVGRDEAQLTAGREALEPVLWAELNKIMRFELQPVTPAQLLHWTGRPAWSTQDRLPRGFFDKLKEESGCDAVLFAQLNNYRAYAPLAVGWNLKLVDGQPSPILWSVDETFDAGDPQVANSARRYAQQAEQDPRPLSDSLSVLASPRRFAQYALSALLATLPDR